MRLNLDFWSRPCYTFLKCKKFFKNIFREELKMGERLNRVGNNVGLQRKLQNSFEKKRRDREREKEIDRPSLWEDRFLGKRELSTSRKQAIRDLPRKESDGRVVIVRRCN